MPFEIKDKLVVAVSSSAVFDMVEANNIFDQQGIEAYREYQHQHMAQPFNKGVAFPFIRRLLRRNERLPQEQPIEVVVLSRNDADCGRRFYRSCEHYHLDITRGAFLSGKSPHSYITAFNASLFLSAKKEDVQEAVGENLPAGLVLPTKAKDDENDFELRLAFDFDGVLSDDESEKVYQAEGQIAAFHKHEVAHANEPHGPGLLKGLLTRIAAIQRIEQKKAANVSGYKPALRIAIVTARNAPSHERMITTLNGWGLTAAELFLMGGIEKKRVLQVLKPHIYFDDQLAHLAAAAESVPSVHIPFGVTNLKNK